ncbi:hypothetical protein F4808DRAFT_423301, partial [Astrocystis sublimbata]
SGNMAPPMFCTPPGYWYCYPGAVPGANYPTSTWPQQSPWWSGTGHYLTSGPPPVYAVEPAYIIPQQQQQQAVWVTAAQPQGAGGYYYYAGAPAAYYYV